MKSEFILGHNFKEYIKEAISIYVASNFLSRAIIDNIKSTLNVLPFNGGKNFRFLLNHDFHEDESMRQVLVNMLLELPNVEVRIYQGPKRFHAKLYIFEYGNTFFTAVGSFNATAGGAGGNIEAGVKSTERAIYQEAKKFFDEHWNSQYTTKAEIDESALFVRKKFRVGDLVIEKSTGEKGMIMPITPSLTGDLWFYSVYISGSVKIVAENDLSHQKVSHIKNELDFVRDTKKVDLKTWLANYLIVKAADLTDRTLLSHSSSRTRTFEYQFRPLFKILETKEHRLLIADEVGLGKTIEAGIILKELSARSTCTKILIIVPNALKTKWRDELQIRFDEYLEIVNYKNLLSFFRDFERSSGSGTFKGIITYDQIVNPSISKYLNSISNLPQFDLIVIDEAHHLKNPETQRHKVVRRLSRNAKAMVMLTATPIQLRAADLYNLLSILLPNFFFADDSRSFAAKLTINERINLAVKYLIEEKYDEFRSVIKECTEKRTFRNQLNNIGDFESVIENYDSIDKTWEKVNIRMLARRIYSFNILNTYVNRTLRRDVSTYFPDRVIETCEYKYTDQELALYNSIIDSCRSKFEKNRSAFGLIMPERRAASSLVAMSLAYQKDDWRSQIEEYYNNYETEDDTEGMVNDDSSVEYNWSEIADTQKLKVDSKLNKLLEIISAAFEKNEKISDKKVLIFCAFRATVFYLEKVLSKKLPYCFIDSIKGDDEIYERDNIRRNFEKNDKPAILICTEVAGEGLDFQFCHYLINYDMPWNPSKLEQRVGRIDRIGQKAEKIFVINLVNATTIEDRIMSRLFQRVKLFNSTIGPLGDVLSKYQKEFKASVLSPRRTQEEKEKYEKKVLENIMDKQLEQQIFEEKEMAIVGAMEKFNYENRPKPLYFSAQETKRLWEFILDKLYIDEKLLRTEEENKGIYSFFIDSQIKTILNEMIANSPFDTFNPKKKAYYNNLVSKHFSNNQPLYYTFKQETALENVSIEHLTLTHPFIQGGIQNIIEGFRINKRALYCSIKSENIMKGNYIIAIYRFIVINSNAGKKEYVEEKYLCFPSDGSFEHWQFGEDIFQTLVRDDNVKSIDIKNISSLIAENQNFISDEVNKMAENVLSQFVNISVERIKAQKNSLNQFYESKIASIRRDIRFIHDPSIKISQERQIDILIQEKKEKIEDLNVGNLTVTSKCTGIVYVEVS